MHLTPGKRLASLLLFAMSATAQMRVVVQPAKSAEVNFRIVFLAGSSADPADEPGLAGLTALVLARGAKLPVKVQVDLEMTTFSGTVPADHWDAAYPSLRAMFLAPEWREEDFHRAKEEAINRLRGAVQAKDDLLATEALYQHIYAGTPYAHNPAGTIKSLENITLGEVVQFYGRQYAQANLVLGIAGGYSKHFPAQMQQDFRALPQSAGFRPRAKEPAEIKWNEAVIVEKETPSVVYAMGFPIPAAREELDYAALLVAVSYFGSRRMTGGGACVEPFPRGAVDGVTGPSLARRGEVFRMWTGPVDAAGADAGLRRALYELNRFVQDGLPQAAFAEARAAVIQRIDVLLQSPDARLGYEIDGLFYNMPGYLEHLKAEVTRLKRETVNTAVQRNLRPERLAIAAVARNGKELKRQLTAGSAPANTAPANPDAAQWPLQLAPVSITIIPVALLFE